MSTTTASGLVRESTMPSRRDISVSTLSSCLVATTRGDRPARDADVAACNPPIGSRHLWGLRGSTDVICGIRATIAGVRQRNGLWNPQIIGIQIVNFGTNRNRNCRVYNSLTNSTGRSRGLLAAPRFDLGAWGHAAAAWHSLLPARK